MIDETISLLPIIIVGSPFKAILVYTNVFYLLPVFIKERASAVYALKLIFVFACCFFAEIGLDVFFKPVLLPHGGASLAALLRINVLMYVLFLGFSFAYFFTKAWARSEKLQRVVKEEQLKTDLNFLKSQINPHFFFNSLNKLFSLALESKQTHLADGIAKLADMMRYMLHDCKAEKVALAKEIEYIQNFISMYKLKYANEDKITIHFIELFILGQATDHSMHWMRFLVKRDGVFKLVQ